MSYFSKDFFWLPAKNKYNSSMYLYVVDGWKIGFDMDDCPAPTPFECVCEEICGVRDTALRTLTLEELEALYDAIGKAISYVKKNER